MTTPSHPHPEGIRQMRCSDEDRELVARVLGNAFAEGRLTREEHEERITQAYGARTFGDLNPLVADLVPVAHQFPAPRSPQPVAARPGPRPPLPLAEFRSGTAILSSYKPGGPLDVGPSVSVTTFMGDAKIDLVGARFQHAETVIHVNCVLGDVKIRIGEGVTIVDNVTTILGDYKCSGAVPRPGGPIVRIAGYSMLGDIKVLGPDSPARKYERFVR